jgi:hypothetical protein
MSNALLELIANPEALPETYGGDTPGGDDSPLMSMIANPEALNPQEEPQPVPSAAPPPPPPQQPQEAVPQFPEFEPLPEDADAGEIIRRRQAEELAYAAIGQFTPEEEEYYQGLQEQYATLPDGEEKSRMLAEVQVEDLRRAERMKQRSIRANNMRGRGMSPEQWIQKEEVDNMESWEKNFFLRIPMQFVRSAAELVGPAIIGAVDDDLANQIRRQSARDAQINQQLDDATGIPAASYPRKLAGVMGSMSVGAGIAASFGPAGLTGTKLIRAMAAAEGADAGVQYRNEGGSRTGAVLYGTAHAAKVIVSYAIGGKLAEKFGSKTFEELLGQGKVLGVYEWAKGSGFEGFEDQVPSRSLVRMCRLSFRT